MKIKNINVVDKNLLENTNQIIINLCLLNKTNQIIELFKLIYQDSEVLHFLQFWKNFQLQNFDKSFYWL